MATTISARRFAVIKAKVMRRKVEALAAEIAATDWDKQPHFSDVDSFLNYADSFIEQSDNPSEC